MSGGIIIGGGGGGGGTPGGSANSVQFNNAGAFGGFGSWISNTFAFEGGLKLGEIGSGNGPTLKAADFAGDYDIPFPDSAPTTDGQVMTYDGAGSFFWEVPTSAGIGGTVGTADNVIPRADGTGAATLQASLASIDDSGWMSIPDTDGTRYRFGTGNTPALIYSSSSLLLQPGGICTVGVSNSGYNGANFYAGRNAEYTAIFDGDSSKSVIIQGQDRNGISSYSQNIVIRAGDQTVSTNTESGANATFRAGNSNSNNAASDNGNVSLLAGSGTHASNNNAGGDVTIAPGTSAGSGGNGDLILTNIKTKTAASDAMTMTNGPTGTAGNPTRFIRVIVDGNPYTIPLWPG